MTSTPSVGPLTQGWRDEAAALLGAVFADDPVLVAILGLSGDVARVTALYRVELSTVPASAVDVATDPDGSLLGVALWHPPGGGRRRLATAWAELRAVGPRGALRGVRHERAVRRAMPDGPAWFLSSIAVSPAARGRGVGGLLLAHRLSLLDASGHDATLEATTLGSRRLYERHGFTAAAAVDGIPGTGSTAMHRQAST